MASHSKITSIAASHATKTAHHSLVPRWLVQLGGLGLFAVAILDSSPIPLPLPGSTDLLLLLLASHRGNPFILATAAVVGSAIGGYLTWRVGKKGGKPLMERSVPTRFRQRLEGWATDHAILSVFASAILPPPIPLTPFLLAAGALGVPRNRFLLALTSARIVRYGLIAWAANTYGRIVVQWWTKRLSGWSSAILWTFGILLVGSAVYGVWQYRRQTGREREEPAMAQST